MKRSVFLILLLLFPFSVFADFNTSGADFLRLPTSARAIGLGGSYTSILGDITAMEHNPAAMNTLQNISASLMYQSWIDDSYSIYASGAKRFGDFVLGGSALFFGYGGFESFGSVGELLGESNPFDLNLKAAVSMDGGVLIPALTGFSVGATLSFVERALVEDHAAGMTMDLGINYETSLARLQMISDERFESVPIYLGAAVKNLGFTAGTTTPMDFTLGLGVEPLSNLLVAMDFSLEYGRSVVFKCGVEYEIFDLLSLRAGFNLGKDTGNLSFGLGFEIPGLWNAARLDYAFSYLGILGVNHNLSIYVDIPSFVNEFDTLYQQGIYHFIRGNYDEAREAWEAAAELDPSDARVIKKLDELEKYESMSEELE